MLMAEEKSSNTLGNLGLRRLARRAFRVLFSAALLYGLLTLVVFLLQDRLLFRRQRLDGALERRLREQGVQEFRVQRPGAVLRGYYRPARASGRAPALLYFGGNAENVGARILETDLLAVRGITFAVLPYRGYGRSEGDPSSEVLLDDALAFYDEIASLPIIDRSRIAVWGLSLGSGPAQWVARSRPVCGAILVAPFARLSDAARARFGFLPISWIFRHEIRAIDWASAQTAPALVFHGTEDSTIPVAQSDELCASWGGGTIYHRLTSYGHADLESSPLFDAELLKFLARIFL